ncbi:hypothetical protein GCM10011519_09690 [Marmoricola endophyticus]|uniref:Uncharacterized protein n=1 Tax=Marmoricola endophyticus TaxID=2040280 RepID=A0A917F0E9_9ACTN|nr:hypothetical protein [Marmoricola endophyticus]GGF38182.1 hypothetical protein GCM10011519_09690 [Marmoricola endophyticus]
MSDYIDLKVVAQVLATGVLLGAGLPLVFAAGLKVLSVGTGQATTGADSADGFALTRNGAARVVGGLCLLVVVAAIVFGIYIITHKG